jgi:hypothetical protein
MRSGLDGGGEGSRETIESPSKEKSGYTIDMPTLNLFSTWSLDMPNRAAHG